MRAVPLFRLVLVLVLSTGIVVLGPAASAARAELVTTEALATRATEDRSARERVHALLDRRDVRQELEALGIRVEEAKARVDALSDAEVAVIAGKLDELPAGGSVLGVLLAVLLIIFLVFILTDILGYTDAFPWVNPAPKPQGSGN